MMATAAHPGEFALAAACCRWPPQDSRDRAIRAAAAQVGDWDRFLRVVRRHRIEGLVHASLAAADVALPPEAAKTLALRAQRFARRNMALAAETARLQGVLDGAEIPNLALKGAALAQGAYGSLALKHSKDIDLMVGADRVAEALALLERQDYRLSQPAAALSERQWRTVMRYGREVALRHRRSGLEVELCWRPNVNPSHLAGIGIDSGFRTIALPDGTSVRTLNDDDLFAYLCVHGAGHAWSRLKWLADLNAWLATRNDSEIERLYRHATAKGAGVCAGLALLLCHALLERPLPADLARSLHADKRLRLLAAMAGDAMAGGDAETEIEDRAFGSTRVAVMQFLLGGGWTNFVAQWRAVSVRLDDAIRYPLPPALHFLYPALRVPLWLWRRGTAAAGPRRAPHGKADSA